MDVEEAVLIEIVTKIKQAYGDEIKRILNRELIIPTTSFPRIKFSEVKEILTQKASPATNKLISPQRKKGV